MIASARRSPVGRREQLLLQLEALGRRLLHELRAHGRLGDGVDDEEVPSAGRGASVSRSYARRASSSTRLTVCAASGAGS